MIKKNHQNEESLLETPGGEESDSFASRQGSEVLRGASEESRRGEEIFV